MLQGIAVRVQLGHLCDDHEGGSSCCRGVWGFLPQEHVVRVAEAYTEAALVEFMHKDCDVCFSCFASLAGCA